MEKRGLSDIVTNVLIILLVLVSVGVIWVFLQPTIFKGAGQLEGAADCLTIQLSPVSCVYLTGQSESLTVKVKRNVGTGGLQDLIFVFTNPDGDSSTLGVLNDANAGLSDSPEINEFETATFIFDGSLGFLVDETKIGVVAVVEGAEGEPKSCQQLSPTRTCKVVISL